MADTIHWGIMGTGNIAKQFARGLKHVPDAEMTAIASRALDRADDFAREFDVPHVLGSYELLAKSSKVDVIYIATPHSEHYANAMLALENGKHLLVEKPFTVNAQQAREVFAKAKEQGLFCMEAFWSRFLPAYSTAHDWLKAGRIGELELVTADFGLTVNYDPGSRLWNPELAGGALLDLGVYPLGLALHSFGRRPNSFISQVEKAETGVDLTSSLTLNYGHGQMAMLYSSLRVFTPRKAVLTGTEGRIELHPPFFCGTEASLHGKDGTVLRADCPKRGNGYDYEAEHVGDCLRQGLIDSPIMPAADTLDMMDTLDAIRASWDLKYPCE